MLFSVSRITRFADEQLPRLMATLLDIEQVFGKQIDDVNIRDGSLTTVLFADSSVSQAKIAAGSLDATVAKVIADNAPIAGYKLVIPIAVPAGATGDINVTMTHRIRVIDVHLVKRSAAGGGAGTIQVKNGANAITDAISIDVGDRVIVAAATIDDATRDISAGGTLRVTRTRTASTDETADVFVECMRVA